MFYLIDAVTNIIKITSDNLVDQSYLDEQGFYLVETTLGPYEIGDTFDLTNQIFIKNEPVVTLADTQLNKIEEFKKLLNIKIAAVLGVPLKDSNDKQAELLRLTSAALSMQASPDKWINKTFHSALITTAADATAVSGAFLDSQILLNEDIESLKQEFSALSQAIFLETNIDAVNAMVWL